MAFKNQSYQKVSAQHILHNLCNSMLHYQKMNFHNSFIVYMKACKVENQCHTRNQIFEKVFCLGDPLIDF